MYSKLAVIGISSYLPGADDYQTFWHKLLGNELAYRKASNNTAAQAYRAEKGIIDHAEYFDPARFNISEKEAEIMDPQTRKFIELVEQGLEDAGYPMGKGAGRVGVIATQGTNHTYHNEVTKLMARGEITAVNQLVENINKGADFLATRAAYIFNFNGPCFNLQSACSSSLTAIVEAAHMLAAKRCDMVIAGGINLSYPLNEGYFYESGSIYSRAGECRPFDATADGTIPSNGGGLVVLKRLETAEADGDRIHGVILAADSNNDGAQKVSYAAPSSKGQYQLLKTIYKQANINPAELKFIECHATGTVVGDPIEVRAVTQLLQEYPAQTENMLLGSVKGHIGHLFWSSGVASLIKAILSLKYGVYPGTANLSQQNSLLELANTKLIITNTNSILSNSSVAAAGVSSFGVGGTNAHVVVARYGDAYEVQSKTESTPYLQRYPNAKKYSLIDEQNLPKAKPQENAECIALADIDTKILSLFEQALGETDLNPNSNYFDHYGDSISAITLIADIKRHFNIAISQEDIFDNPTPAQLGALLKLKTEVYPAEKPTLIDSAGFNQYQKRFYLLEKLQRGSYSNYNVCLCLDIDKQFPKTEFNHALQTIANSIPVFSKTIQWRDGDLVLGNPKQTTLKIEDLTIAPEENVKAVIDALLGRRFSLETGPSCHLSYIKHSDCEYLIINIPHLLIDGKGIDNLLRAVAESVNSQCSIEQLSSFYPKLPMTVLSTESRDYWKKLLTDVSPTVLKDVNTNLAQVTDVGGRLSLIIGSDDFAILKSVCEKFRTTPFVLLYAFFNFHLYQITGESKLCTGTTLINRDDTTRDMIGCFINNIPVVINCKPNDLIATIETTKTALAEGMKHSNIPYDVMSNDAGRSGTPLYSILFMLQNQNKGYELQLRGKTYYESATKYSPIYGDICINIIPNNPAVKNLTADIDKRDFYIDVTYDQRKYGHNFMLSFMADYKAMVSKCLRELEKEIYVN